MTAPNQKSLITQVSNAKVPTSWGEFMCFVFRDETDGIEHLAFVSGDLKNKENVLVRAHSECITGDIFHSRKCDCGDQLDQAMSSISEVGGVFIYLRGHEGRGIGIGAKIQAYALQEQGLDTVQANEKLGLPIDGRNYAIAGLILKTLDITSIKLITNNKSKVDEIEASGINVAERISLAPNVTTENLSYLQTKNAKLGHLIEGIEGSDK
ncbi:MAG TPA: GTP cyclohydrolase II [Acidimicrobiia bacterium]|nr:GTP cyclohydrolase II [Acidimicrobiia bacterium]